jgi:hypothetical protein
MNIKDSNKIKEDTNLLEFEPKHTFITDIKTLFYTSFYSSQREGSDLAAVSSCLS